MTGNEISVANEQQKAGLAQPAMGFSIVGIGASAGGVMALQSFFEALPDRTGLAFVVIVHLAPESPSELPRILGANPHARYTG